MGASTGRRSPAGLALGALVAALVAASCDVVSPPPATPAASPVAFRPVLGADPVVTALASIDPLTVLRGVEGGAACQPGTIAGGHASDDAIVRTTDLVCQRFGNDRTVYFLFEEAYAAELERAGVTVTGSGREAAGAEDPISTDWSLRGEFVTGTARLIGVNEPGLLHLFVTLDIASR